MGELDRWRFCPSCGAELGTKEDGKAKCPDCGFTVYASSKPTASALCLDGSGRILLSRRGSDPFEGQWDLPGGFLEEGEHPLDCLRRELREETGLEVEPLDFLGTWMDRYGDEPSAPATLNLYWAARVVEGSPEPADDVTELRWFAPDEVPVDELAFQHIPDVLSAWRARQEKP